MVQTKSSTSKTATYLTVADVAAKLGLSKPDLVLAWIHRGELSAVNVALNHGGKPRWRIDADALEQFLAARTPNAKPIMTRRRKAKSTNNIIEFF